MITIFLLTQHHNTSAFFNKIIIIVKQIKIIVDVLGGYSLEVRNKMKELFGEKRARECLMKMQKSVLSNTLNIARCFKVMRKK